MKISKEALKTAAQRSLSSVFVLTGLGGVGYGTWQIYPPAAFIIVGGLVLWMGLPER